MRDTARFMTKEYIFIVVSIAKARPSFEGDTSEKKRSCRFVPPKFQIHRSFFIL